MSMNNEPQAEHRWLHRLVGEWEGDGEMPAAPGEAATTWRSLQSVRKIGELWIQCEARIQMADGGADIMQITLGYDTAQGHYVGVFAGSMMSNLWIYQGKVEADGRTLTLDTEGPDFGSGQTRRFQDIVELIDDDRHELRSRMLGDDGQWQPVMTVRYRRTG
ncbi:hypothetical protein ASE43_00335 [Lysobacter sp. Root983]|nr:hypothetical protein ASD69_03540 [Lysobacter sp. Root604]KRD79415.1 hypothetical protein ASE43_00335 [Lysobacter sp. Root983]